MRSWMLVVIVVAACSKDKASGPAAKPGEPAGDVLEVTGGVTAHRGDEPMRALKVGDVVSGDDVIGTTADGAVVIKLRHNGVRWSLRGNHDRRLSDSAAWKQPAAAPDTEVKRPPAFDIGFAVEGEVMPAELDAAVANKRDALLLCVDGKGTRAVTFTVGADGKVGGVAVGEGALTVDEACVAGVFGALTLPAYANPTSVTVSLSVGGG